MNSSPQTHEGRTALVTGAGQGIGQAIAITLAKRGARVIATDLTPPNATVGKIGSNAYALQLDVMREEDRGSVFAQNSRTSKKRSTWEQQAIERLGEPADITGAALFPTGDDAACITGQAIVADGGKYRVG